MENKNKTQIGVVLDADLKEKATILAKQRGMSLSVLIRVLLLKELEGGKK